MDKLNNAFDFLWKALLTTSAAVPYTAPARPVYIDKSGFKTDYPFVMVSGFWSWGVYNKGYKALPYWGFFTGENYVDSFTASGITTAAADVSPLGSAWDRACELYAQLTGTVVDYGRAHSEKYHHSRYGEDYTGRGLLKKWDSEHKINIICHSFGGPTSALFATLLCDGSAEEKAATTDGSLSPLFEGGKSDLIHSITGLAGAYNGTTLIVAKQAIDATEKYVRKYFPLYKIDPVFGILKRMARDFEALTDGKVPDPDTGLYDMVPDHSVELNKTIHTVDSIYYFTVPCQTTHECLAKNAQTADRKITDIFFAVFAQIIGMTDTSTPGGLVLGKEWQPNDGLVNTISEYGPAREKKVFLETVPSEVDPSGITKGRYHVLKTYPGSHNDLCGGTLRPNKAAKNYLTDIIKMINSLEK